MQQKQLILVICEDLEIHWPAASYALALAHRMESRLLVLMLLSNETDWSESQLGPLGARIRGEPEHETLVDVEIQVRRGDPRSELSKFMAFCPTYHAVVWAGDPDALRTGVHRGSGHWINTVLKDFICPVMSPDRRTSGSGHSVIEPARAENEV